MVMRNPRKGFTVEALAFEYLSSNLKDESSKMESDYCPSSSECRIDFRISITKVHLDTLAVSTACSAERLVARKSYLRSFYII
jgi:hypothetical protein